MIKQSKKYVSDIKKLWIKINYRVIVSMLGVGSMFILVFLGLPVLYDYLITSINEKSILKITVSCTTLLFGGSLISNLEEDFKDIDNEILLFMDKEKYSLYLNEYEKGNTDFNIDINKIDKMDNAELLRRLKNLSIQLATKDNSQTKILVKKTD